MFVSVTLPLKKKISKNIQKNFTKFTSRFLFNSQRLLELSYVHQKIGFFTRSDITCLNILMPLERHNIEWPTLSILLSEHMIQYFSIHTYMLIYLLSFFAVWKMVNHKFSHKKLSYFKGFLDFGFSV